MTHTEAISWGDFEKVLLVAGTVLVNTVLAIPVFVALRAVLKKTYFAAAILALLVQLIMIRAAMRSEETSPRAAIGYRVSAALLVVTIVGMAVAQYV